VSNVVIYCGFNPAVEGNLLKAACRTYNSADARQQKKTQ
jgi:hypothetical protein